MAAINNDEKSEAALFKDSEGFFKARSIVSGHFFYYRLCRNHFI